MRTNLVAATLISIALALPAWGFEGPADGQGPGLQQSSERGHGPKHRGQRGAMHEKLKNMTQEERQAFHKEVKEKWEALSEQEKAEFKAKMEARKAAREEQRLMRQYGAYLLMQQENSSD